MKEPIIKNPMAEAIFRQAVIDNYERELAEIDSEPDMEMSDSQKLRMRMLFAKERRHTHTTTVFMWARRFTAVAASIFILLGGALLTVPEIRASVGQTIVAWYDTFVQFGSGNQSEPESVELDWLPGWLPDGFTKISESKISGITTMRYANAENSVIEFKYVTNDNALSANNEGVEYGQTSHNGKVYHTFSAISDEFKSTVVWDTDGYLFNISGYVRIDQLLEIAWSVERK
jgi:hypothetical protein